MVATLTRPTPSSWVPARRPSARQRDTVGPCRRLRRVAPPSEPLARLKKLSFFSEQYADYSPGGPGCLQGWLPGFRGARAANSEGERPTAMPIPKDHRRITKDRERCLSTKPADSSFPQHNRKNCRRDFVSLASSGRITSFFGRLPCSNFLTTQFRRLPGPRDSWRRTSIPSAGFPIRFRRRDHARGSMPACLPQPWFVPCQEDRTMTENSVRVDAVVLVMSGK
jgi:hypothetical protein